MEVFVLLFGSDIDKEFMENYLWQYNPEYHFGIGAKK